MTDVFTEEEDSPRSFLLLLGESGGFFLFFWIFYLLSIYKSEKSITQFYLRYYYFLIDKGSILVLSKVHRSPFALLHVIPNAPGV